VTSIVEAIARSTVLLICELSNGNAATGTGFLMNFHEDKATNMAVPVIITNRHVIKDSVRFKVAFARDCNGVASNYVVVVDMDASKWTGHPDPEVDLCAIPIAPIMKMARDKGEKLDVCPLPMDVVATEEDMKQYLQLDEVVMVGYPDGIVDVVNNPIFRRGTFATNPALPFRGKKQYVTDIAAFNGSSGSPVFVVRQGVYFDRKESAAKLLNGPGYTKLVGILYGGFNHHADGRLVVEPMATIKPVVAMPNNLGIVIRAERLFELEKAVR